MVDRWEGHPVSFFCRPSLSEEGGELCYRHDPDLGARASGVAAVRTALFLSVEANNPAACAQVAQPLHANEN